MKDFTLNKVIEWLLGGAFFAEVKGIVAGLADENISGTEKRSIALTKVKSLAGSTATFVANLAIEAAVYLLRLKTGAK